MRYCTVLFISIFLLGCVNKADIKSAPSTINNSSSLPKEENNESHKSISNKNNTDVDPKIMDRAIELAMNYSFFMIQHSYLFKSEYLSFDSMNSLVQEVEKGNVDLNNLTGKGLFFHYPSGLNESEQFTSIQTFKDNVDTETGTITYRTLYNNLYRKINVMILSDSFPIMDIPLKSNYLLYTGSENYETKGGGQKTMLIFYHPKFEKTSLNEKNELLMTVFENDEQRLKDHILDIASALYFKLEADESKSALQQY